ncbi:hypothetical protein [Embleya sp. NPDC005971]|uniref:hypothetical protein n=1 Tax=Embleya sp. NPDC005971 TaxID=3156724 RepID=UPI0033D30B70
MPDPTDAEILNALRGRLVATRGPAAAPGTFAYRLDATTVPGPTGDVLRQTLNRQLRLSAGAMPTLVSAGSPSVDAGVLRLTGTSDVLTGDPLTEVSLVFTVSADRGLRCAWTARPPADWQFTDSFPELMESRFEYLPLTDAVFIATTHAHVDPAFFFPLYPGAGLNFQATLAVRSDLRPVGGAAGDTGVQRVRIGGRVVATAPGVRPSLQWGSEAPLGPLTAARFGQSPSTVRSGRLRLECGRDPAADVLIVQGSTGVGRATVECSVDLPTSGAGRPVLRITGPLANAGSTSAALALCGVPDAAAKRLPTSLLDLAGATVTGYAEQVSPAGDEAGRSTVTLGFGTGEWTLIPGALAISGVTLAVTVIRAPAYPTGISVAFSGTISGTVTLGGKPFAVRATVPANGPWRVEITDDDAGRLLSELARLDGLAGFDAARLTAALPPTLVDAGRPTSVSAIALLVDPVARELREVSCTIAQPGGSAWPVLGGLLTLSGWAVDLTAVRDAAGAWTVSGALRGRAALGSGPQAPAFDMRLPVPARDDEPWTLVLDRDTPGRLPSIGHALALLGGDPTVLPAGIATLGALTLTRLAVALDPRTLTLTQLSLAFDQSADAWTIIDGKLAVRGVSAALVFDPETDPVGVLGTIDGELTLCGSPVDVTAVKNDFAGGWQVLAGFTHTVHVPGFEALDGWLAGPRARAALPAALPLAKGFDVCRVALAFSGAAGGALARFGFAVEAPEAWTLVPGRLALTGVTAEVRSAYPVTADTVVAAVFGTLAIGATDIRLGAVKPAPGRPWEFTGRLAGDRVLDVAETAAAVAAPDRTPLALPSGAKDRGLSDRVTLTAAEIRAIPETGALHLEGRAEFDAWRIPLGAAKLPVTSIGATLDLPGRNAAASASVTGTLEYAGLRAAVTLALGAASAPTVLTGTVTVADAPRVSIAALTDGVCTPAAGTGWRAVAPGSLAPSTFGSASLHLNATTSQLMLSGQLARQGAVPACNAFVYLAPDPRPGQGGRMHYAVSLVVGAGFRFDSILPAAWKVDDRLRVGEAHLVVSDLAGTTLGELSRATAPLLERAGLSPAPLKNLGDQALTLSTGVACAVRIDFARTALFAHLLEIGIGAATPTLWLAAMIEHADPSRTVFTADLPDITIARTVRLTHTPDRPRGIRVEYRPALADRVELAGRVELVEIFGRTYAFDVTLVADAAGLTTRVRQGTADTVPAPFMLRGLALEHLSADIAYRWAVPAAPGRPAVPQTSTVMIRGRVLLGPAPRTGEPDRRLDCAARLVLRDGVPVLYDVSLAADWSLAGFLAQCFTGTSATRPGTLIDVGLRSGTRISYYEADRDPGATLRAPDGTVPRDGYTIDARLAVRLIADLDLHAIVTVLRDPRTGQWDRVAATAVLDAPLDLGFMSLAGTTRPGGSGTYQGGPELGFETGPSATARLSAGINFLGEAFAVASVSVAPGHDGGRVFTGRLTSLRSLSPFGPLACGFRYSTHPAGAGAEFALDGWPSFGLAENLVDFVSAIKALADAESLSLCGPLGKLVARHAVNTSYTVTPAVTAVGDDLVFSLTGTCSLTLVGADAPFLTSAFPAFAVHIPTTTRWDRLPGVLADGIRGAAAQFARALLADPAKIALFLALVVGEEALDVATVLLCDGLITSAAVEGVEAAALVLATIGAGGILGSATVATLAAAIAKAVSDAASHGGPGTNSGIGTPALHEAGYDNGTVAARWAGASRAAGYTLAVFRPDGTQLASRNLGLVLQGALPLDPNTLPPGDYPVRVRGIRGPLSGLWSEPLVLSKPAPPTATLAYGRSQLVATGTPQAGTEQVVIRVFDPNGVMLANEVRPASAPTLTVPLPVAAGSAVPLAQPVRGAYTVQTQALGHGHFPGAWSPRVPYTVLSQPAPTILSVTQSAGDLTIAWNTPVPCDVAVVDPTTNKAVATSTGVLNGRVTLSPSPAPVSGRAYYVHVWVNNPGVGMSGWAGRVFNAWVVAAPARAELRNDLGTVTASWTAVATPAGAPAAPTYTYELVDSSPGSGPYAVGGGKEIVGTDARGVVLADGRALHTRSTYRVRVRAEMYGNTSAWTTSPGLLLVTLPRPLTPQLTADDAELTLVWTDPPNIVADAARTTLTLTNSEGPLPAGAVVQLGYEAVLSCGGTEVGRARAITARGLVLRRADGRRPAPGEEYTAQVRLATPQTTGPWAPATGVVVLGAVRDARAYGLPPKQNPVSVSWTAPIGPLPPGLHYEVVAIRDRDALGRPLEGAARTITTTTVTPTSADAPAATTRLATTNWFGYYIIRVRARTLQAGGPWSDAATLAFRDPGTP